MRPWLRLLAHGFAAGLLLSLLRAPLGLDWTQLPALAGPTAALFRAGALLGLALSLDPARRAFGRGTTPAWIAAVAAGYAAHGLELVPLRQPASRTGAVFALLLLTSLLRILAGPRERSGGPVPEPLARTERLGLVLTAMGAALSCETLAREVRLFGLGLSVDDTVAGTVFLLLVCAGALAFGPLWSRAIGERARLSGALALSAGACVFGLLFLARLTPQGLFSHLQRFEGWVGPLRALDRSIGGALGLAAIPALDGTSIGTAWTTALLAAAAFVVPAFFLGAGVGASRHAGRISHALAGAAFGVVFHPYLVRALAQPIGPDELRRTSWSWTLLVGASLVAGVGMIVVSASREPGHRRWTGLALALGSLALPWVHPRLVLWSFSPWSAAAPIEPELVVPTDAGLLTIEAGRGGTSIVTLDRRRLTPTSDEEEVDARRLRTAWALLEEERRAAKVRALFIGQLTPQRSRVLRALGQLELDRTAPWFAGFPALEEVLFRGEDPPLGRAIAPGEARARIHDGAYDWIVVPPVHGPVLLWKSEAKELWGSAEAPIVARLSLPEGELGVAWLAADSLAARRVLGESVVLALEGFEHLSLGVVRGDARVEGAGLPPLFPAGDPAPRPRLLELLRTLPLRRSYPLERALSERLASAAEGGPLAGLARGLALHFGAQQLSSPYETRAQQIELEEDELRSFASALRSSTSLDPFTRELWEALAWLVAEKRLPELAWAYLEPVAERFAPWPALDRALGRAYREMLEPESALRFLERALQQEPNDIALLVECGTCARELGDAGRSAAFLERALAIQPGRPDLERELGLALLSAGDERGRTILVRLLAEHPEDGELREALGLEPQDHPEAGGEESLQDGDS